jgi:hypothetical protein
MQSGLGTSIVIPVFVRVSGLAEADAASRRPGSGGTTWRGAGSLVWARAEFGGQFLGGGLAAQLTGEPALYHGDLADGLGHVNRD